MIFRLDGGIENLLALTPVLVEWRRRYRGLVLVETCLPEVFSNNVWVDKAGPALDDEGEFVELNIVPWMRLERSVTETYAERVLGDTNMASWSSLMFHTPKDESVARKVVGEEGRVAAFCFEGMGRGATQGVENVLRDMGFAVVDVGMEKCGSLGVQHAAIGMADVFVGTDGNTSSVAFATETPAVVCHTWRDSCYFRPFRRGVPYEDIVCGSAICSKAEHCASTNAKAEFGRIYAMGCDNQRKCACQDRDVSRDVKKAMERIFAAA